MREYRQAFRESLRDHAEIPSPEYLQSRVRTKQKVIENRKNKSMMPTQMAKKQGMARHIDPFSLNNDDRDKILGLIGTAPQFVNSPDFRMKKRNNNKLAAQSGY